MTKTSEFQELIWAKSRELYRGMPWGDEPTFYRVLVSELRISIDELANHRQMPGYTFLNSLLQGLEFVPS